MLGTPPARLRLEVLVPTYRRAADLRRCLDALGAQTRAPDRVIVVVRDTDEETREMLAQYDADALALAVVTVAESGAICAMRRGLALADGDVLAITDDDAAPWPDWLARIEAHFAGGPQVGGVGGRDWLRGAIPLEFGRHNTHHKDSVGKVRWYGRVTGDHHLGEGNAREVDVLKGVNCAYRTSLLRRAGFDGRLWGRGAQVHWELALGYGVKAQGYSLVYDPAIGVDHYSGTRHDEDQRVFAFHAEAHRNSVHNETLVLLEHLGGGRRLVFLAWALMVGTRVAPGLAQVARLWLKRQPHVLDYFRATQSGRLAGQISYRRARRQAGQRQKAKQK